MASGNPRRRVDPEHVEFVDETVDELVGRSISGSLTYNDKIQILLDDYRELRERVEQLEGATQEGLTLGSETGPRFPSPGR